MNNVTMRKWYVEYRAYGKIGHVGEIEAKDGNEAVKYVKEHIAGINKIIGVWHDDEED